MIDQDKINMLKVDIPEEFMKDSNIEIIKSPRTWQEHLLQSKNLKINNAIVCLDSAEDRIAAQAALPRRILNAWTQQESIGISRHFDFLNSPCLTCLYIPDEKK